MKIVFTGGGTGGHLFPIIAISRELQRLHPGDDIKLYYAGPKDAMAFLLLEQENIKPSSILAGKIRRYFSFKNIIDILFTIPLGFFQSFLYLLFLRPKLVFSKGGTGSAVMCLAAVCLGIPVFIHESDIVPGASNRFISTWAQKVFISFEKTEYFDLSKAILVGNPIRKEIMKGDLALAQEVLGLTMEKPVLLFWGGSQGAQPLNDFLLTILNELLKEYEVIHVCGKNNITQLKADTEYILDKNLTKYYHLYESINEIQLKHALAASQLIVSRAGSGSIFEIAAVGKPSILIALPESAGDHQAKNAYEYASSGAAIIIEQDNLTPNFFLGKISYLLLNEQKVEEMKEAAFRFSKPLAAKSIARQILEFLHV